MTDPEQIGATLKEIEEALAISLITDIGNYFTAMKEVVKYTQDEGLKCVYVTATIPSSVILAQLASEDISTDHVHFVDCISYMVGTSPDKDTDVLYIESPTMIDTTMLKIHTMIKMLGDDPKLVFLDSVNTLSLHNDEKVMQEFVHYLINALRVRKVPSVVLSIEDQTPEDLEIILKLVCDGVIEAVGEEEEF
jgi:KaiC/GvpD/RAD55 family RecA-like ATPase